MKIPKFKKNKVIVYDSLYNVKKSFTVYERLTCFVGNKLFLTIILIGLFIGMLCRGTTFNNTVHENKRLVAELEDFKLKYDSLQVQYEKLLEKEEKYHIHYLIGKYTIQQNSDIITKDSLYSLLDESEIWYPDVTFAQIVQESSMGKLVPDGNSNNLIGMKFPTRRETTAYGKTESGYAKYKNWQLCVLDKILWDYTMFGYKKPSRDVYIDKIQCIYAEDPNYLSRLEGIIKKQYKK